MGAPRIQPRIYEYLKANPGKLFAPKEIVEALKFKSPYITGSLNSLVKHHPSTMKREPIGTGRLALFGYRTWTKSSKQVNGEAAAPQEAQQATSVDVLVTVPVGNNQSATLTLPQAKRVFEQLREIFGSK